ncbi:MAG TPA: glycosyltransferase [Phycisphaerae bacterium]|nr:glycosyltransferase [Phycisphaerae bacterium]
MADRVALIDDALLNARPAHTRDGHLSFRISADDGQPAWLGRTSIPLVRAEVLLEKFDSGTGNVLLPGLGQGMEVSLLLLRLGSHRAVFVWETQAEALALAMRLHDWHGAIATGRLKFLVCSLEQLAQVLPDWLDRHPGYLCPERIMMWPWSAPGELAACRSAVQRAYEQTDRRRGDLLAWEREEFKAQVRARVESSKTPGHAFATGPLVIMSLHVREDLRAVGESLAAGAAAGGLQVVEVLVRGPADLHPLGRLRKLRTACDEAPSAAVLLDCGRQQVQELCPRPIPVLSWVGPAALPTLVAGLADGDGVAATTRRVAERLKAAGWNRGEIPVVPYPCVADLSEAGVVDRERPIDVLLVGDIGPTDPEPFGYSLHTHCQLWKTASELIRARIETFTEAQGVGLFARGEQKCGVRLEETPLRRTMVEAIGTFVADTLLALFLAQPLSEMGLVFRVAGRGWEHSNLATLAVPSDTHAGLREVFRQSKLVVWANVTGEVSLVPLMAAGSGAVVLAKSHPRDAQPGGLITMLEPGKEMLSFNLARELVAAIRQLLARVEMRARLVSAARSRCLSDHLPQHRIKAIQIAASSYSATPPEQL